MLTSAGRQSGYGSGVGGGQNFDANVYRCAACGVDSSGEVSFIQHIRGKAHAGKAGRYGFAGLLVNDAGVIPPLSFDPSANPRLRCPRSRAQRETRSFIMGEKGLCGAPI